MKWILSGVLTSADLLNKLTGYRRHWWETSEHMVSGEINWVVPSVDSCCLNPQNDMSSTEKESRQGVCRVPGCL